MSDKPDIGVINEIGDLGLGFEVLNDKDKKILEEQEKTKQTKQTK